MSFKPLFLASCLTLSACAGGGPAESPADVDKTTPDKAAPANVKPDPVPSAHEALSTAPLVVSVEDMPRIDPGPELTPILKSFHDKLYFDSVAQLEEHDLAARRNQGSLDYQLQVYAMAGNAHAMMGETDEALRHYRKVLSKWQHPKSLSSKLMKAHPDDGEARVARSLDAFGEALFFMAEQKRAKLETLDLPYNDVGDQPNEVKRFLAGPVKRWLRQRSSRASVASKEYDRVGTITPGTPERWVIAGHSRKGLMAAQTLELVRSFSAPLAWGSEGDSEHAGPNGKPLAWTEIRAEFEKDMAAITAPLLEEARSHYSACVDGAKAANVNNAFVVSCTQWLKANK